MKKKNPKDCENCIYYIENRCEGWSILSCKEYQDYYLSEMDEMRKPEPLKGKTFIDAVESGQRLKPLDVRSAVEWLKESLIIYRLTGYVIKLSDVNLLIDEAFEDVMKDETK